MKVLSLEVEGITSNCFLYIEGNVHICCSIPGSCSHQWGDPFLLMSNCSCTTC